MKKSITFVLSGSSKKPCGGVKIIYEYANRLSQKNWIINVVHPHVIWPDEIRGLDRIRKLLNYFRHKLLKIYLPSSWFKIDPKVNMLWVPNLKEKHIPNADFVVACPLESSFFVADYSEAKGKKFYFIQHFEDWNLSKEIVEKSWKLPLQKIVIAKWLADIGVKLGQKTIYIPNGLNFDFFEKNIEYKDRIPKSLLFLNHELQWKGTRFAVDAAIELKKRYQSLHVSSFGVYSRPKYFPDWIQYFQNPPQEKLRELYNNHAIFISPSLAEGWPLPPAEALMCGAILIATDIGGHLEYARNNENALICKTSSADSIIEKVEYVFNNPEHAESMSVAAPESLKRFDWDSRVCLFEEALLA